jgi:hypothetical protein
MYIAASVPFLCLIRLQYFSSLESRSKPSDAIDDMNLGELRAVIFVFEASHHVKSVNTGACAEQAAEKHTFLGQ